MRVPSVKRGPLHMAPVRPESFRIPSRGEKARVIDVIPGQILTGNLIERPKSKDGWVLSDIDTDILKLAVVERHRGTGHIGLGLVRGFGLKEGALASSVAHDSHNVITVGVDDQSLCRSVLEVKGMGGGLSVVRGREILARVPLEFAGLMSMKSLETLIGQLEKVHEAAASLGCSLAEPFMALSFLSLPVIPALKLTDRGLVDVNRFCLVPLFVDNQG
jgi:adenine deaminase